MEWPRFDLVECKMGKDEDMSVVKKPQEESNSPPPSGPFMRFFLKDNTLRFVLKDG